MGEKLEKRDKQQGKKKKKKLAKLLISLPGNSSANTLRVNLLRGFLMHIN